MKVKFDMFDFVFVVFLMSICLCALAVCLTGALCLYKDTMIDIQIKKDNNANHTQVVRYS